MVVAVVVRHLLLWSQHQASMRKMMEERTWNVVLEKRMGAVFGWGVAASDSVRCY